MPKNDRVPVEILIDVARIVRGWPTRRGYGNFIAAKYEVSEARARGWVSKARDAGLLPSGTKPRPCRYCGGTGVTQWNNNQYEEDEATERNYSSHGL